jgi:hypothetical protein
MRHHWLLATMARLRAALSDVNRLPNLTGRIDRAREGRLASLMNPAGQARAHTARNRAGNAISPQRGFLTHA